MSPLCIRSLLDFGWLFCSMGCVYLCSHLPNGWVPILDFYLQGFSSFSYFVLSGLTTHNEQNLLESTWPNHCLKSTCPFVQIMKTITLQNVLGAPVCSQFSSEAQHYTRPDKPMALPSQVHWQMDYWSFTAHRRVWSLNQCCAGILILIYPKPMVY
jgi:hypothetical protein